LFLTLLRVALLIVQPFRQFWFIDYGNQRALLTSNICHALIAALCIPAMFCNGRQWSYNFSASCLRIRQDAAITPGRDGAPQRAALSFLRWGVAGNKAMLKKLTILRDRVADWNSYPFAITTIRQLEELSFRSRIFSLRARTARASLPS
jgi:hypothetical protein